MCGIAGIFDRTARTPVDETLLRNMAAVQRHRGPDDEGLHIEPGTGLAHRRLSIIDLSGGKQPFYNEDKNLVVVYNGEIYNFKELTRELMAQGHVFRTRSDTEVIVHAWKQWGPDCVEHFRGMFAFALWDRDSETLFLARDRLGIKPLFYAFAGVSQLLFASEAKALMCAPNFERKIDPYAVEDYFAYGYIPEPRTIFRDMYKLPPGHTLTFRRGAGEDPVPRRYWDVPFRPVETKSARDIELELVERLRETVRLHMVADVPVGAFLSGGVDSSAVVAMMADISADPVETCSIGSNDPQFDESGYATTVARRFGTRSHLQKVDADDFDLINKLAEIYDEPYADSSAIPTYRVCELARKHVTVALTGDGGDENFAGYHRYRWHQYVERFRSILPLVVRGPLFGFFGRIYPKLDYAPRIFRLKTSMLAYSLDSVGGFFTNVVIVPDRLRSKLFSEDLRRELQDYHAIEVLREHAQHAPTDDPLSLVQYLDLKTYLPGDILTKVDRASMVHSLEVRVPLLDHVFVEWVSGLPSKMKLDGMKTKAVFKRAMQPFLPAEILDRRKLGFAVPLANWLRGPLRERARNALLDQEFIDTGLFNGGFIERLVNQHQSGHSDHSAALWALLMFEAFARKNLMT